MATVYQYIVNIAAKNQQFLQAMQQNVGKINDVDKKINQAQQSANKAIGSLTKMAGALGITFSIGAVASFTGQLIQLSGEAEGVRNAFTRIGGARDLDNLKKSVHGTVSELNLMKRAVTASNFGIPVKELGNLFQFATKRAQDTGQSVDYLVDSIVTGIGRKSPLILDNLGISAVQLKEKLGGIGLEMASVGDITRAVGEIAAESMTKSGDIIDTNAIKIQRLKASWEDFKLELAENPGFNKWISGELDALNARFQIFFSENLSKWEKFRAFITAPFDLSSTFQVLAKHKQLADITSYLTNMQADFTKEWESHMGKASMAAETVSDRLKSLNKELIIAIKNSKNTSNVELFLQGQKDAERLKKEIKEITEYLNNLTPKKRDTTNYNTIETKRITSVSLSDKDIEAFDNANKKLDDMSGFLEENREIVDSLATSWISFGEQYNQVIEDMMKGGENITAILIAAGEYINSMMSYAESGTASLDGFLEATKNAAKQAINVYIAEGVAAAVKSALISFPFPFNMIAAATAAAAATSLFNSLIPGFETGGVIPGTSFSGDQVLIRANSGEEILTRNDPRHSLNQQTGYRSTGDTIINQITFSQDALELKGSAIRFILKKEERRVKLRTGK